MSREGKRQNFSLSESHDGDVNSEQEEAAQAAWEGADLERPLSGEDPQTRSLDAAKHWIAVYSHLIDLEQELLDILAKTIPNMPEEARKEAEETNLPVLASQVERFRHRKDFWVKRRHELEEGTR